MDHQSGVTTIALGCARFPDFFKNLSERQILWSLCSVDFHTLTLQLPIQTLQSVAPELQVFVSSLENRQNFSKTSTPLESQLRMGDTEVALSHASLLLV